MICLFERNRNRRAVALAWLVLGLTFVTCDCGFWIWDPTTGQPKC